MSESQMDKWITHATKIIKIGTAKHLPTHQLIKKFFHPKSSQTSSESNKRQERDHSVHNRVKNIQYPPNHIVLKYPTHNTSHSRCSSNRIQTSNITQINSTPPTPPKRATNINGKPSQPLLATTTTPLKHYDYKCVYLRNFNDAKTELLRKKTKRMMDRTDSSSVSKREGTPFPYKQKSKGDDHAIESRKIH